MKLLQSYRALALAELDYAAFNARRTLPAGAEQPVAFVSESFGRGLVDHNRPDNPYYNRFVPAADTDPANCPLENVPPRCIALELPPPLQTPALFQRLLQLGWSLDSSLCYLHAQPTDPHEVHHMIKRLEPEEALRFFDLIHLPEDKRKPLFYCRPPFHCYVAFGDNGEPLAWATLYVGVDCAFLGNAETLPAYRNRGIHSALLVRRLNDAHSLGLKTVYTDVVPGSQSHANCEAAGFRQLCSNLIWVRAESA